MVIEMTRPKEFDARVLAWLPFMRRFARRYTRRNIEDLVQAAVVDALERWQEYRQDGNFVAWLKFRVLNAATADLRGREKLARTELGWRRATEPAQEYAADLHSLTERLGASRGGVMLLRSASGETMREISLDSGMTTGGVHFKIKQTRPQMEAYRG
jgi:RNA polymerase sigma factor (sigma-70 family)